MGALAGRGSNAVGSHCAKWLLATAMVIAGGPDSTAPLSAAERARRKREQDRAAAKLRRDARAGDGAEQPTTLMHQQAS